MTIEIFPVGGYSEVGKNMTAVKVDNEVVIFDMGFYMQKIVDFEESGNSKYDLVQTELKKIGAVPNDELIRSWFPQVKAIVCSHAHLDHIGAVPFLAGNYHCPVYGTPFTISFIREMLKDEHISLRNQLHALAPGQVVELSEHLHLELIHIPHSTPQTALIALHTKQGTILYANEFKFDDNPVIGKKPDYERLKELGKEGVIALIADSLYSDMQQKTPSELVAREMLKEIIVGTGQHSNSAIIVSCFASHIARIKSVIDFSKKINRKVVILGRSMMRYAKAAENVHVTNLFKEAEIIPYAELIHKKLARIQKEDPSGYVILCTGGQGEPRSVLSKMVSKTFPFHFTDEDIMIFSNRIIPVEPNIANREKIEKKLQGYGVRIFKNVHVSVTPDTEVIVNDSKSMKIKKIKDVMNTEDLRVPAFDPSDLKIKWYNAEIVKHPYTGNIYTIETKSGRNVEITEGHSVFKLNKGKIVEIQGDGLKKGDYIVIPRRLKWDKEINEVDILEYIDLTLKNKNYSYDSRWVYYAKRKILPRKIKLDINFARLLGYYLAEGSAPRHIAITFGSSEKEIINECKQLILSIFPSSVHLKKDSELQFGSRIIGRLFKFWFGKNSHEKRIPDFVYSSSQEFKFHFLGAYLTGDAHPETKKNGKSHPRLRVKTASKKLASDLLYLFSHLDICAKFDHVEYNEPRFIGGNKKLTGRTKSYVLRIQGRDDMLKILPYVFKDKARLAYNLCNDSRMLGFPPTALPLREIPYEDILAKPDTNLRYYITCLKRGKRLPANHIYSEIIKRDSLSIQGFAKKILDGDLLFDPVQKITVKSYQGDVYDFKVPGPENFIGGFGGIVLHNSGHGMREDIRDMIKLTQPENLFPTHGPLEKQEGMAHLGEEMGYKLGKNLFMLSNGQKITL